MWRYLKPHAFFKSPSRRCGSSKPFNVSGCQVVVHREGGLFCLIWFAHSGWPSFKWSTLMPALVSGNCKDVCVSIVEIPYGTQCLYVGLYVRAASVEIGGKF